MKQLKGANMNIDLTTQKDVSWKQDNALGMKRKMLMNTNVL